MKKLIIILALFIITMPFYSQTVDTSAWAFKTVGGDGTYRLLENRSTYLGKSAGTVVIPLQFDVNGVDTANWGFLPIGSDGTFRLVYNKETFYGKDSGTVVAQLVYPTGSPNYTSYGIDIDTTGGSFNITANTLAGEIQYVSGGTGQTIATSATASIVITNSYITANSKVIVNIHEKSNGIPVISYYKVENSQITVLINNLDASSAVEGFSIRFFIIK